MRNFEKTRAIISSACSSRDIFLSRCRGLVPNVTVENSSTWTIDDASLRGWLRSHLSRLSLDGRKVRVDRANRNQSAERRVSERDNRNTIFLGNLSWDVTADLLEDMLNDLLGPNQFLKVRVNIDKETGRMRGFAHVDFVDEEATERALTELDGIELLGRALRVDRAKRSDESKKPSSDDLQP